MDIQLKRGLLDICVLSAIKNQDSYGYKIIKDLKPYISSLFKYNAFTTLLFLLIEKIIFWQTECQAFLCRNGKK